MGEFHDLKLYRHSWVCQTSGPSEAQINGTAGAKTGHIKFFGGKQHCGWNCLHGKMTMDHPFRCEAGESEGGFEASGCHTSQNKPSDLTERPSKAAQLQQGVAQKALGRLKQDHRLAYHRASRGEYLAKVVQLGVGMPVGSTRTVSEQMVRDELPAVHARSVCMA